MPVTLEQFVRQLTESGLLTADEVSQVRGQRPPEKLDAWNAEQLARELVRQKKLTKFQAEQLYAGKGKSLTLGNYVILDKLGQGGMGMVLKARHRRMERIVALKVIAPHVVENPIALQRFQREVVAAAKLSHPNVVAAYDADEAKGTHFLVMEYVEGTDLAQHVKQHGPLPAELAIGCIVQAARGLAFAHEQGVVHRDIKPHNLLLDPKGTVKILDMGLARLEGTVGGSAAQADLTNSGAMMGTVDYMSPEQAMDAKHADARSDIYSLGCTLFFLMTGRATFVADTMMKRLTAHQNTPAPSLELEITTAQRVGTVGHSSSLNVLPGQLPALNAAFQRMVAKRPADRFQSMAEVIVALERCRSGLAATVDFPGKADSSGPALQSFLEEINDGSSASVRTADADSRPTAVLSSATVEAQEATLLDSQASSHVAASPQLTITESAGKPSERDGNQNHRRRVWVTATIVGVLLLVSLAVFMKNDQVAPHDVKTVAANKGSDQVAKDEAENNVAVKADDAAAGHSPPVVAPPDVDRAIAEWARTLGCVVGVEFSPEAGEIAIAVDQELPAAPFRLNSIRFEGPKAERLGDQLIERLDGARLRRLQFLEIPLTNAGVERLSSIASLSELSDLSIRSARVDDDCLKHFDKFKELDWVSLEAAPITDACFTHFKNLTLLNLARTRVTDDGLRHLKDYPRLIVLNLSQTSISDAGLKHLAGLTRLQELQIDHTKVTPEGIRELRIALPKCNIATDLDK
ncbi:MAG: protein kinase domain-containing protein [Planctomycetaceae bacterium]